MRVLSIVSNPATHDPRVYNEARTLRNTGHSVHILGWDRKSRNPLHEEKEGIKITRIRNSFLMKLVPFDFFRIPLWCSAAFNKAVELHQHYDFEAVHCHDLDTLSIGVKLKKKFGMPLIYDAHEIWGYMIANDMPQIIVKYVMSKEKKLVKHVDAIITVNEPLKSYFESICDRPVEIVMNAKPIVKKEYFPPKNRNFTLSYIGTLIPTRFILEMMEVVSDMEGVKLIIGGKGKESYIEKIRSYAESTNNIIFLGVVPQDDVIKYTCQADAIIVMTSPEDRNSSIALTNKQFEAMVCGRPIITTKSTYPGEFTEKHGLGIAVDYSKDALRKGILYLKENPEVCEKIGRNALQLAIREYNWSAQEHKILSLYEKLKKGNL